MRAYKFRGADQIPFAFDIILRSRLHCSDWRVLNDPLEGRFSYTYQTLSQFTGLPTTGGDYFDELAELVVQEKNRKRVCSLSLTAESSLLWAHYASGFAGLAIEVEIPDPDRDQRVVEVDYEGPCSLEMPLDCSTSEAVLRVLSSKFPEWRYEEEVRIIQDEVWFPLATPVRSVICGPRMNDAMYEAIKLVCRSQQIPISQAYVDGQGIDLTGSRSPSQRLAEKLRGNGRPA